MGVEVIGILEVEEEVQTERCEGEVAYNAVGEGKAARDELSSRWDGDERFGCAKTSKERVVPESEIGRSIGESVEERK